MDNLLGSEERSLTAAKRAASECAVCSSCSRHGHVPLVDGRTQVVFGSGSQRALLMFIGEAPGKHEDKYGRPFVGKGSNRAGAILDGLLQAIGLLRPEIYLTNLVKCRPTRLGKNGRLKNRAPEEGEIAACTRWLGEEIRLIEPRLVVSLGVPATEQVLGRRVLMKDVHGRVLQGRGPLWKDRWVIPTYHPTGIRGNEEVKKAVIDDFERIRGVYKDVVGHFDQEKL